MNWFKNLRIKSKLIISFTLVTVFSIILALLAVLTVIRLDSSYTYLLDFPQKRLEYLMQINTRCSDMRRTTTVISMNVGNADVIAGYWEQFEQAYSNALDNADRYIESNRADTVMDSKSRDANNEVMRNLKAQLEGYRVQVSLGAESARSSGDFETTNAIFLNAAPMIGSVVSAVGELIPKAADHTAELSELNTGEKNSAILLFAIVLLVIIVLSVVIAIYVSRLISRPINLMTSFMKKAGTTGDIMLSPDDVEHIGRFSQIKDEVGECIGSTASFVKHMADVCGQLEIIAGGNLTSELAKLSDNDVMVLSLNNMTANLSAMFNEIQASAAQIADGSRQIADGAQSLAQGSTEQAAAIEELSSSIGEIADKTKQNAVVAKEASELSGAIRGSAEKGSTQMDQMMQAVREINEASNQINKVIKVIDDIAFQTNILALNAAVEAARAGQHGKGFAVVAEEVRNLAAKSAEAAKDTGGLIENSIAKANLGLSIANETSASLKEIVEGINHSAEIVTQIARSSDEQAGAIMQINTGIDQVAQVVQQNSATAEQSAAASEEMSGQSGTLEHLISQFKLRDSGLPPSISGAPRKKALAAPRETAYATPDNSGE